MEGGNTIRSARPPHRTRQHVGDPLQHLLRFVQPADGVHGAFLGSQPVDSAVAALHVHELQ